MKNLKQSLILGAFVLFILSATGGLAAFWRTVGGTLTAPSNSDYGYGYGYDDASSQFGYGYGYGYEAPECGSANGSTVSSQPSSNLCVVGTASSVSGSGPWTWTCSTLADNADAISCSASKTSSSSSSGGGGGGSSSRKDYCPNGDNSSSYYDGECGEESNTDSTVTTTEDVSEGSDEIVSDLGNGSNSLGCLRYEDEQYSTRGVFSDVSENLWGYKYIEAMRLNCIHRGRETVNGGWVYYPNKEVTKAEVMKTFVKIMGLADEDFNLVQEEEKYPGNIVFEDIQLGNWASWYAEYAKIKGIVTNLYVTKSGLDYFSPDALITRYATIQMAINTYEAIHGTVVVPSSYETNMVDFDENDPYYDVVSKAEYLGIIQGRLYSDGIRKLDGNSYVTRQEFAKIAYVPFSEYFVSK